MSISEKANDLLNKFGSAQFDFMVWNKPDNLVARDKARQEISDYIAELEAAQRWIPVGERTPRLFETVLIWAYCDCDGYDRFDLAYNSGLVWVGTQQDIEYEDVTHWMALPKPPKLPEVQE